MALFEYRAISAAGREVSGVIDAPSPAFVLGRMEEKNLTLIAVEEASARQRSRPPLFARRVSRAQLANFSNHLSAMLAAGMPLIGALQTLAGESESKALGATSEALAQAVGNGRAFSEALADHPAVFSAMYISMIRAGEESGALSPILARNAAFLEKQDELASKLRDALTYPLIIAGVAVVVIAAMLAFVIPRFVSLLAEVGAQIPWPTRLLIFLSDLVVHRWYAIAGGLLAAFLALAYAGRSERVRAWIDRWKLRAPVVGPLLVRVAASRFARTLATLLESGLSILPSLELVRGVVGNRHLERVLGRAGEEIRDGAGITAPLKREGGFPPMMIEMIHVGESSGSLDTMLHRVADLYEKEVDRAARRLTVLLEPAMILAIGGCVGFVALALLLPMVKAIGSIGR